MKFRKKPLIIDAVQFKRGEPLPDGVRHCDHDIDDEPVRECCTGGLIDTLEGTMIVRDGDWVITGVMGEKYSCRSDVFEATYEALASSDTH